MKKLLIIWVWVISISCTTEDLIIVNPPVEIEESTEEPEETDSTGQTPPIGPTRVDTLLQNLNNSNGEDVMVIAHRAVFTSAPENSISSIEAAIALGVDMVELDIRETKDGVLILMHDETIDRMTSGKGRVADLTYDEIHSVFLQNRQGGALTSEKVPTFKEAMQAAKGKILVRVDKAYSLGLTDQVLNILEETETLDHAAMLVSKALQPGKVAFDTPEALGKMAFMPGVDADGNGGPTQAAGYLIHDKVVALESSFSDDEKITIDWKQLRKDGARIMVYTGSSGSCGGHDDEVSLKNVDAGYGWLIDRGVNMIQTDESAYLLNYLRIRGLHK